jgi:hypothetical protein
MNSFTFLFETMKETHEQHKTKIDIDELITGPTNITLLHRKEGRQQQWRITLPVALF